MTKTEISLVLVAALAKAERNKDGHPRKRFSLVEQATAEVQAGMAAARQ
ncbi:MAG TPA: hypothetical protein VGL24_01510 [Chthoniobacterales bacterium]